MKKIPVKKKLASLKPSSTLAINEKCKELTASGKKIYKFGFGQSPFPIPQSIINCLKNNANRKNYLPMQGLPELREAISKYLTKKTAKKLHTPRIIKSLYFDNINLDMYKDSIEGSVPRKKIRVRYYPGTKDQKYYLEMIVILPQEERQYLSSYF